MVHVTIKGPPEEIRQVLQTLGRSKRLKTQKTTSSYPLGRRQGRPKGWHWCSGEYEVKKSND